jgi:hypothetical protein
MLVAVFCSGAGKVQGGSPLGQAHDSSRAEPKVEIFANLIPAEFPKYLEGLDSLQVSQERPKDFPKTSSSFQQSPLFERDREELQYLGFMASAAYCEPQTLLSWDCGRRCQMTAGVKFLKSFSNSATEVVGYIAITEKMKQMIISFRGSETLVNWLNNLRIETGSVPWKHKYGDSDPQVHEGFLAGYESVSGEIIEYVKSLLSDEAYTDYTLVVTGHSLGGALAILCAADLREVLSSSVNIRLVSYETPRVGNADFANYVQSLFPPSLRTRITHGRDLVIHTPPYLIGYRHIGQEVFINGDSIVYCSENDEDPSCANAWTPTSLNDHLWYESWKLRFGFPCEA